MPQGRSVTFPGGTVRGRILGHRGFDFNVPGEVGDANAKAKTPYE